MIETLFTIPFTPLSKKGVNDAIDTFLSAKQNTFYHITSLNPEIMVIAQKDETFRSALVKSSLKIVDGVGVLVAAQLLNIHGCERYPGVDLMKHLLEKAGKERLATVLIGGKANVAVNIADCYNRAYKTDNFHGLEVSQNISGMNISQKKALISQVYALKPRIVLVAFGSPTQEKWIDENLSKINGALCMGVGGGFDFVSGEVRRAPRVVRAVGLEWLFRLILQPWRIRRQMRLVEFAKMTIHETIATYGRR